MKVQPFFDQHPVFRYDEFAQFMKGQGVRPATWKQQLGYHHKAGHLLHVRRHLYRVKPRYAGEGVDPYVLAGKATQDAVIAYHSALEFHGLAYTTFSETQFLTKRPGPAFSYAEHRFRPIRFPTALIAQGKTEFGVDTLFRQQVSIRVTSLERTLGDVLNRPELGGGFEEIWRSLENVTRFDVKKLIDYTLLLKSATLVAKVGFFLDQRPSYLKLDASYINQLLPYIPKQPHYMDRKKTKRGTKRGKYIEKWQLIVPREIIDRTWEEPYVGTI